MIWVYYNMRCFLISYCGYGGSIIKISLDNVDHSATYAHIIVVVVVLYIIVLLFLLVYNEFDSDCCRVLTIDRVPAVINNFINRII